MKLWSELCLMLSVMVCEGSAMSPPVPYLVAPQSAHDLCTATGVQCPSGGLGQVQDR